MNPSHAISGLCLGALIVAATFFTFGGSGQQDANAEPVALPEDPQRLLSVLKEKDPLWIEDFNRLAEIGLEKRLGNTHETVSSILVEVCFGKPHEQKVLRGMHPNLIGYSEAYEIQEWIYPDRLTNPLTGKRETLVVKFHNHAFDHARALESNRSTVSVFSP